MINWNTVPKPSVVDLQREEKLAKMFISKILEVTRELLIMNKDNEEEKDWIRKRRRKRDVRKRRRKTKQRSAVEVVLVLLTTQVWTGDH